MTPEFCRFKNTLKAIGMKHDTAIDIQCKVDNEKSTIFPDGKQGMYHIVLYLFYGRKEGTDLDDYDYFFFDIPAREKILFDLELFNFMESMA